MMKRILIDTSRITLSYLEGVQRLGIFLLLLALVLHFYVAAIEAERTRCHTPAFAAENPHCATLLKQGSDATVVKHAASNDVP